MANSKDHVNRYAALWLYRGRSGIKALHDGRMKPPTGTFTPYTMIVSGERLTFGNYVPVPPIYDFVYAIRKGKKVVSKELLERWNAVS